MHKIECRAVMYRIVAVYIALLTTLCVHAQLLYEISGAKLKKNSYIFVTNSLVTSDSLTRVDGVFKCYNKSDIVMCRTIARENEAELYSGRYKQSVGLKNLLSPAEYNYIDSVFNADLELSLQIFELLMPLVTRDIYYLSMYEQLKKNDDYISIEAFFPYVAAEQGKTIVALESAQEYTDAYLSSRTLRRQAEILKHCVKNKDRVQNELLQIEHTYLSGDIDSLCNLLFMRDNNYTQSELFLLIDQPNDRYVKQLDKYLKKNSCFIALDAVMLYGKSGLINKLQAKGYKVRQIQ